MVSYVCCFGFNSAYCSIFNLIAAVLTFILGLTTHPRYRKIQVWGQDRILLLLLLGVKRKKYFRVKSVKTSRGKTANAVPLPHARRSARRATARRRGTAIPRERERARRPGPMTTSCGCGCIREIRSIRASTILSTRLSHVVTPSRLSKFTRTCTCTLHYQNTDNESWCKD